MAENDSKDPTTNRRPVVLCILDGWGERAETEANAIALARTPHWDRFVSECPHATLEASAEEVGLPAGQMGNSEVGHMNLGAGRIVVQDLPRIDAAAANGELANNTAFRALVESLRIAGSTAHLMGLLSPGGVHSHQNHMVALARALCASGVPVAVHAFLDGRDTPPRSADRFLEGFEAALAGLANLRIATIAGRYYAMDRDRRWDRTDRAYRAMVEGDGRHATDPITAIRNSHDRNIGDEFVEPLVIADYAGMCDGDGILMANFRADRVRQILSAIVEPEFDGFERRHVPSLSAALGMVEYSTELNAYLGALFPSKPPTQTLGEIVSAAGLRQLRVAETEKYAHVTFFLNGGREAPFPGEERILVPSPKVATYDLQPEMSAPEVTDRLVEAVESGRFDFIVVNFANTDMVGHSGKLGATIEAVEAVDTCLGRLADAVSRAGGAMLITADHGNAEFMTDPATGDPHTAHSTNRVPCLLINGPPDRTQLRSGRLADVAPTVLELLDLPIPSEMTGRSLLSRTRAEVESGAAA